MDKFERAVLAGGCFWCIEAQLQRVKGVSKVVSGYAGGALDNPKYEEVKKGDTGHYEVVEVTFDPAVITYRSNSMIMQPYLTSFLSSMIPPRPMDKVKILDLNIYQLSFIWTNIRRTKQ